MTQALFFIGGLLVFIGGLCLYFVAAERICVALGRRMIITLTVAIGMMALGAVFAVWALYG